MMITPTGITISFGGARGRSDDSRPVVAQIFGFARGAEDEPVSHEMVVPAGQTVEQKLDEGLYNVQLTLPSGRILQRNVKIGPESNEVFHFFEDFVPNAGFSLQESVGRGDREVLAEAAAASGNTSDEDYAASLRLAADVARHERESGPGGWKLRGARYIDNPDRNADMPPPPAHAGLILLTGLAPDAAADAPEGAGGEIVEPEQLHGDSGLWRIAHADAEPPTRQTRRWALIALPDGRVELASLPLPWFCAPSQDFVPAELLVDPARGEGAATTVAMHDRRLSGLLAYLDRGQAGAAGPMLQDLEGDPLIRDTILEKTVNPLAACAAAYVGLAVYPPNEREEWDRWLGNCMSIFPDIPDAAIVHARRLVLRPTSEGDNARAANALRQACAAGVPFFSTGVLLLREMLVLLSPDHPDLAALADKADRLAGRIDPSQAFTVLRYAPPRKVTR